MKHLDLPMSVDRVWIQRKNEQEGRWKKRKTMRGKGLGTGQ